MKLITRKFLIAGQLFAAVGFCMGTAQLNAAIIGVAGGTSAAGPTLGPYTMTPFGPDPTPDITFVDSVASPLGGTVDFSTPMLHLLVPTSWATWSHGYNGDVYWTAGDTEVTLTLPAGTGAFYLFAQPNPTQFFDITAEAQDGTKVTQTVDGQAGAANYGFYATGGDSIMKITVSSSVDFAVGEFGIAKEITGGQPDPSPVPDKGNLSVLLAAFGLGGMQLVWRRRTV